jgi:outer membrane protein assembly factor BamB
MPTGCASARTKIEVDNEQTPHPMTMQGLERAGMAEVWSHNLSVETSVHVSNVYLYENQVLVTTLDNFVYAFDRISGQFLWVGDVPQALRAKPTLYEKNYYGISGSRLVVIDQKGRAKIGAAFRQSTSAPFIVVGGYIYAPGSDGSIHKLDIDLLADVWLKMVDSKGAIVTEPVLMNPYLVYGDTDGMVSAIDIVTGRRHLSYKARDGISGVVVDESNIFFASSDYYAYSITLNGTLRWKQIVRGPVMDAPILAGDVLYVVPQGIGIHALDKNDGSILWENAEAGTIISEGGGRIFAKGDNQELLILDSGDGKILRRLDISDFGKLPVNDFGDGLVYLVSSSGRIVCLRAL